ncbi:MAG TPA: O-antigen polymerase [Streptosporangiaceae bacterium]|nr:O-antigen polymerase [Streptosporangiaceae bacterium]
MKASPQTAALSVLAILGVAALSFLSVQAPWLCAWLLLFGAFVIAARVSWRTSPDPFAPLLPVTAYLFLGLGVRGLALHENWLPDRYNIPLSDTWLTTAVFLLGALATFSCVAGYRSQTGAGLGHKWGSWQLGGIQQISRHVILVFSLMSAVIGVASLILLHRRLGGFPGFGQTPAVLVVQANKGGYFTLDMLAYFPLAGVLIAWRRSDLRIFGKILLITNILLVLSWFALAGRKSLLFELIFGIALLRHYLHRPIRGRLLAVALIPVLIGISFAFYFKLYGFNTRTIATQYSQQPLAEAVIDPLLNRSYQFDAATVILAKTKSVSDYKLGGTFSDLLWFYIPRQWWPGKPVSFSYSFAAEYFPAAPDRTSAYTPGMVGELYLNFGIPGVAVGFYVFGLILRACYEAFARRATRLETAMYIVILWRLTQMVEGPITTHIQFVLAESLPIGILIIAVRFLPNARLAIFSQASDPVQRITYQNVSSRPLEMES